MVLHLQDCRISLPGRPMCPHEGPGYGSLNTKTHLAVGEVVTIVSPPHFSFRVRVLVRIGDDYIIEHA